MKAVETELLEFMEATRQLEVPVYQRPYSWGRPEWEQLWDDVMETGADDNTYQHFVGCVVYMERDGTTLHKPPSDIIDGQQRLATVSLLLEALSRRLGTDSRGGLNRETIHDFYLWQKHGAGGGREPKLLLANSDRAVLERIVFDEPAAPADKKNQVHKAYQFFSRQIRDLGEAEIDHLCAGLSSLAIVDVSMKHGVDDPQRIFEGLNSTGKKLLQSDLIRNAVLMGLDRSRQSHLYTHHWHPMEQGFAKRTDLDGFMRHYLAMTNHRMQPRGQVYEAFKRLLPSDQSDPGPLVEDVCRHSDHYLVMTAGADSQYDNERVTGDVRDAFRDVAATNPKTHGAPYPFLLELFEDWARDSLDTEELIRAVRMAESYVTRRVVCGYKSQQDDSTFAELLGGLNKSQEYVDNVAERLEKLEGKKRFPTDDEFSENLARSDLYTRHKHICVHVLSRIERDLSGKEAASLEGMSVEHIMPQTLSDTWKCCLGNEAADVHKAWLHRLGNLTLTGVNPELSNKSFKDKCRMPDGFRQSGLRMNRELSEYSQWGPDQIAERGQRLAELAIRVFPTP